MMMGGEIGPDRRPAAAARRAAAVVHGCFTFMKWFELIRHKYGIETLMLHVPYQEPGPHRPEHAQLRGQAAEGNHHPGAGADLRRQVRHRPACAST
jgi:hypothetical protein